MHPIWSHGWDGYVGDRGRRYRDDCGVLSGTGLDGYCFSIVRAGGWLVIE